MTTLNTADVTVPSTQAMPSDDEVQAAAQISAEELYRRALRTLGYASGRFDAAVEDYERRVAEGRPYENTVDREELRRRYGV